MSDKNLNLQARAEMEEAAKKSEKKFASPKQQKLPKRYHLYDKIKKHVTVGMMDVIIVTCVILIVLAIVIGMIFPGMK